MHILVTNDDGANATGLLALAQELRKLAVVDILAPGRNWSGGGIGSKAMPQLVFRKLEPISAPWMSVSSP